MIAFGLGVLRLTPDALWALTPRELALVIDARSGSIEPPDRHALNRLMQAFPDEGAPLDERSPVE